MKNWNYKKQMTVGIVIVICGFVLATITKLGIFTNIAWIVYGLMMIIHPVCPEAWKWKYAGDERRINRDCHIAGAVVILLGLITRFNP